MIQKTVIMVLSVENLNLSEEHCPDGDDNIQNNFDKQEELLRLPCFTHTLQLVVKDELEESECIDHH